jgi:hypothetical protein
MGDLFFVLSATLSVMTFSVLIMMLVRKKVHHKIMEKHNDVAGFIYAVIGVIYAVLLAFVVVAVWEIYRDAQAKVEVEVKYMADLFRDVATLSPEMQKKVQGEIVNYANIVTDHEWKLMADGGHSDEALVSIHRIFNYYKDFRPQNVYEEIWYAEQVSKLNDFSDARNMRIVSSTESIPSFMWIVLVMGAMITIGFSFLFGTENSKAQALMISALSGIIMLVLLLILAMNHPFKGSVSVSPEPFVEQMEHFKIHFKDDKAEKTE